jgi:hypothetical protein
MYFYFLKIIMIKKHKKKYLKQIFFEFSWNYKFQTVPLFKSCFGELLKSKLVVVNWHLY